MGYRSIMPDDLYNHDALAWSEEQVSLLRRVARGERVNEVDWPHVIEEIEDVGLSELHAVESHLELLMVHLLKAQAWPADQAINHWHAEIVAFQSNAVRRFSPSMKQRINLTALYRSARNQVIALSGGQLPNRWPDDCPLTLDQLLTEEWPALKQAITDACSQPGA